MAERRLRVGRNDKPEPVSKSRPRRDARIAREKQATPEWARTFMAFANQEIMRLVKERERHTGIKWHRDHIVPIAGANVCGLNVPWNIRVVPAIVNRRKATKLIEVRA